MARMLPSQISGERGHKQELINRLLSLSLSLSLSLADKSLYLEGEMLYS